MCWFADVGFFVKKHRAMAALKDPAALVWCSAETVSSKSTQKQTSFVPGIGCLKVDYGRISTKTNLQREWCFSLQASCPFGFENKESPKAIPNVATREPLPITPYAPAPSSLPSACNLGPGFFHIYLHATMIMND
jgi:hypothetical protein